jgi:RimJ/RimL family protein N-acetyltransferase
MAIRMDCGVCMVRSWHANDAPSLAQYANNREIWLNLRDRFPHPYTLADAEAYLRLVAERPGETSFAIEVEGQAVGGVSLHPGADVERCSAEIGYWLGEPFWGRGIMTAAVRAVTGHAFERLGFARVFAVPYSRNPASSRVLEKAGYEREGLMRRSAIKDGVILDQYLYAKVRQIISSAK